MLKLALGLLKIVLDLLKILYYFQQIQYYFQQTFNTDPADTSAKMYNDTCSRYEIMMQNKPEAKDKWIRTCPKDVKSCFWAQGDGSPKENGWYLGNGNNVFRFIPIIVK